MASYEKKEKNVVVEHMRKALEAFRADMPEAYAEVTRRYEGGSISVGVFGVGMASVAVHKGQVEIAPNAKGQARMLGRGAAHPETLAALAKGKMTLLDAFHRGELVVQAEQSQTLHEGYNLMAKYGDSALRSARLQEVFAAFCEAAGIKA